MVDTVFNFEPWNKSLAANLGASANPSNANAQLFTQLGLDSTGAINWDNNNSTNFFNNIEQLNSAGLKQYGSAFKPISIVDGKLDLGSYAAQPQGFDWGNALGWANVGLDAIGKLGNLWGGLQQLKLAKQQLALQKDAFNFNKNATTTNFNNSVNAQQDAYRRQGEARYSQEGLSGNALNQAVADRQNSLQLRTL